MSKVLVVLRVLQDPKELKVSKVLVVLRVLQDPKDLKVL